MNLDIKTINGKNICSTSRLDIDLLHLPQDHILKSTCALLHYQQDEKVVSSEFVIGAIPNCKLAMDGVIPVYYLA
jgi:hypothetical protein